MNRIRRNNRKKKKSNPAVETAYYFSANLLKPLTLDLMAVSFVELQLTPHSVTMRTILGMLI